MSGAIPKDLPACHPTRTSDPAAQNDPNMIDTAEKVVTVEETPGEMIANFFNQAYASIGELEASPWKSYWENRGIARDPEEMKSAIDAEEGPESLIADFFNLAYASIEQLPASPWMSRNINQIQ